MNTREFRSYFQRHVRPKIYEGRVHFVFTLLMAMGLVCVSTLSLDHVGAWEWTAVPLTFIYNNLTEYFGHKGPMHHPRSGLKRIYERHTLQHHKYFTHDDMEMDGPEDYYAVLFPPTLVVFFVGAFGVPMWFVLELFAGANVAWLFVATSAAYFLNYEIFHYCWHLPERAWIYRLPIMRRLRQLHVDHHNPRLMSRWNFNISYPLGDVLFGTHYKNGGENSTD